MPHSFGPDHDHPTLSVDRTGGRFHGALYVASIHFARDASGRTRGKMFMARSMNGGKSFGQITKHDVMTASRCRRQRRVSSIAVNRDGIVVDRFAEARPLTIPLTEGA